MSNNYLRLIPCDPTFVPPARIQKEASALLKRLVPKAEDVQAIVHDDVAFIDQGENFEDVRCPSCKETLDMDWWQEAMGTAGEEELCGSCRSCSMLRIADIVERAGLPLASRIRSIRARSERTGAVFSSTWTSGRARDAAAA